ncbi:MAG: response regulator, partial [Eubacterium sp.]
MHVAVYLKNKETRSLLSHLLEIYQKKSGCTLSLYFFKNNIDLLADFGGGEFDIIFFGDSQCQQLIQEIREKDKRVRLVHITGLYSEIPDRSDIWYHLPDPPNRAFLFPILRRLNLELKQEDETGLLVKSRGCVMLLSFSSIEYAEVIGKSVFFHLTDGTTEETSGTFSVFEARLLLCPDFIKVHRAYIVNLRHIKKLKSGTLLTTSGHSVPVSRSLYPQFKKAYLCRLMDPEAKEETVTFPAAVVNTASCQPDACSILLVDDEPEACLRFVNVLTAHGCTVQTAQNSETALELATQSRFDAVVLDVKLGAECGFDLCAALMEQTGAPVIFLSILDDSESQTRGFLSGGIDYITKDTTDTLFWLKIESRIKMAKAAKAELTDGSLH